MKGKRVQPDSSGYLKLAPGEYGKDGNGIWRVRPPTIQVDGLEKQQHPLSGTLSKHTVKEHEDGTITVSPSILIQYLWGDPPRGIEWHGFLERGIWRQV